jgi:hypothetical protein
LLVVPEVTDDQVVPFQRMTVPPLPTAQTSLAAKPNTALRFWVMPLAVAVHAVPS